MNANGHTREGKRVKSRYSYVLLTMVGWQQPLSLLLAPTSSTAYQYTINHMRQRGYPMRGVQFTLLTSQRRPMAAEIWYSLY